MLKKFCSIAMLALFASSAIALPAQKRSARPVRGGAAAPDTANKIDLFVPASALAVMTIPDIRAYQSALSATTLFSSAKETSGVEPIESLLNELTGGSAPAGVGGAIVLFSDTAKPSSENTTVALLVEGASLGSAKTAFANIQARLKGAAAPVPGPNDVQVIKHKAGAVEYELARAGQVVLYGTASNVDQMIKAFRGEKRLWTRAELQSRKSITGGGVLQVQVDASRSSPMLGQGVSDAGIVPQQFLNLLEPALQFLGIASFKSLTLQTRSEGGVVEDEIEISIDWNRSGLLGAILKPPPLSFQRADLLPANSLGYFASGIDLTQVYDLVLGGLGPILAGFLGGGSITDTIATYENDLGFKIRDGLLSALGPEYLIALVPAGPNDRPESRTRIVGMVEVKNADILRGAIKKLKAKAPETASKVRPETYRGVELEKFDQDFCLAIQGSTAYLGEPGDVKRLIDLSAKGSSTPPAGARLGSLRPVERGRSMEFLISREGFRMESLTKWVGKNSRSSLADLLAKRSPSLLEGTATANGKGLRLVLRNPIGLITAADIDRGESVVRSGVFGNAAGSGKGPSTELAGLIWLAGQFAEGR